MPDYSKGKIYKILNNVDNEIYVGSTTETLGQRMARHRQDMKHRPHYKLYKHMYELNVENFYIELIENFPCNDVYELRAREGHFIREIGTMNKNIAGRTYNKWREENKEHIKSHSKQYYEDNKHDKIKQYREDNKELIKTHRKQYYENNKDYLKEYDKQYHEKNKEHIQHRTNKKITCNVCGCQVSRGNIARHQKTEKCKSYVKPDDIE